MFPWPSARTSCAASGHALSDRQWPPTVWSHDRAAWTVEAKFIVNDYGLRNRLAIITETPGQPTFERRIYAQYAYMASLLEYTNRHETLNAIVPPSPLTASRSAQIPSAGAA